MKSPDPSIEAELEAFRARYRQLVMQIPSLENGSDWATDNETVFTVGAMRLRHFKSENRALNPVLIVYSHVNSPHVIDLHQDHSLVRRLMECGHDVFLLDVFFDLWEVGTKTFF